MNQNINKNKKKAIILLCIGIILGISLLFGVTYSYWKVTKTQSGKNQMVAMCLDFTLTDETDAISFGSAWPMSDSDALKNLTGYTFKVTNNCSNSVNYVVGLEALPLTSGTFIGYGSVGVGIDYSSLGTFNDLSTIDAASDNALIAKQLFTDNLAGNESKSYTLKIWINDDAPVSEQGKQFLGSIFITGGQNISGTNTSTIATSNDCFTIDADGQITGYDEDTCGRDVIIPTMVNNTLVKSIDTEAFKTDPQLIETTDYEDGCDENTPYNSYEVFEDDSLGKPLYVVALDSTTKGYWETAMEENSITDVGLYLVGDENIPDLVEGNDIIYVNLTGTDVSNLTQIKESIMELDGDQTLSIDTLDLSKALYLEKIETKAFTIWSDSEPTDGLDGLTFGNNTAAIKIEDGAFAKLETDSLTLYTSGSNLYENVTSLLGTYDDASFQFYSSNIKKLYIKYDDNISLFNLGMTPFYKSYIGNIVFEEGITEIGGTVFFAVNSLENQNKDVNLTLPSTLKTIGCGAFAGPNILNFSLPDGLVTIGESAFTGLTSVDDLVIPDTVTTIGDGAFANLDTANSIHISTSLTTIPRDLFEDLASDLDELIIPDSITSIGEYSFRHLTNVGNLQISNNVTTIGRNAFQELVNVNDFTLPATLRSVDRNGFGSLTSSTTVTIKQTDGSLITKGDNWLGEATIVYSP